MSLARFTHFQEISWEKEMANCYQEQPPLPPPVPESSFQEIQEGGSESSFQMLPLNSTTPSIDNQFTAAATITTNTSPSSNVHVRPFGRCANCGSVKRQSPSSSSLLQESPSAKKIALHHPSSTFITANAGGATVGSDGSKNEFLGSGKVSTDNAAAADASFATPVKLPASLGMNQNVLSRSISDITSYVGSQEIGEIKGNVQAFKSQLGENSKMISSLSSSPSQAMGALPPLPPVLHRSISEPISSDYLPVPDSTPSRTPSAARTFVPSSDSDQESADSRRLRRIRERMKQMNQWVQKVVTEEDMDEDPRSKNDNTSNKNPQKISKNVPETRPNQEAVWVEESGENLIVHFKCPCGSRYEIFLSGKKCYYRLM